MSRHFTVAEANGHLRFVEPVLRDAVRLKREHDELSSKLLSHPVSSDRSPTTQKQLARIRGQIRDRIDFITGLGVQIKDLDHGLIDFPSVRDGEEVLLCWYLDEPSVAYWHSHEDGFPGRQPV